MRLSVLQENRQEPYADRYQHGNVADLTSKQQALNDQLNILSLATYTRADLFAL